MMRAYISLPISGTDDYRERSFDAEMSIRSQFKIKRLINPIYVGRGLLWHLKFIILKLASADERILWLHFMKDDIRHIFDCTDIFMCNGWQQSEGCQIEHKLALGLKLRIWVETEKGWTCCIFVE